MIDWSKVTGFDWDAGNTRKSADKHDVSQAEAEQIFLNAPLIIASDETHSSAEQRLHALGHTDQQRRLHITFTLRVNGSLIRIISARDMSRKERAAMTRKPKLLPTFSNEAEERAFWEKNDSADFVDWTKAETIHLPNLKPSTTSISLRLPISLLEQIKIAANKRDVPYQSLIKTWLAEKLETK